MAIEKTGAQLLRRFVLPKKNIDLALVRTRGGMLELYKNSKIPGTQLDSFTKVAEKAVYEQRGSINSIIRTQFSSDGREIGKSIVTRSYRPIGITVNDKSVKMPEESSITFMYLNCQPRIYDRPRIFLDGQIQFLDKKLTPMARRVLKLFNQAVNKR